ncbi:MAG: FtsX-like permease family protein, partial [Candidatus Competibacterales bacterium]|nr:FtsX-like permease family protein [Candidatus Competibacterales bacterium]
ESGWRLRDYTEAAPRLQEMIDRLTLFLVLVGLTALLVGGVGVSNAVRAYLDGKLATLAMFKCVGAPRRTLFQIYLAQLLVLAAGGIAIGLVIGALTPPVAAQLLTELLPVPIRLGVYPLALINATAFGLLTTLTFAVWPLARAVEIPGAALFRATLEGDYRRPRRRYLLLTIASAAALAALAVTTAIDKRFALWFVAGALATLALFRLTAQAVMRASARMRRPRRPGLRLALANLHRPGAPTPSVVLSLGLGLTVLVAIGLIEGNMNRQIQDSIPEQAPSFFFLDIQSSQIEGFRELVNDVPGTEKLMTVPYLRGPIVRVKGMDPAAALVQQDDAWMIRGDRGITYASEPPANATTAAGEWWPPDYEGPPLLSVHADAMDAFDLALGDTVTFNVLGREVTGTVAHVRDLEWSTLQLNFAFMFSPEPLRSAPHGFLATVAATPEAETELQRRLTREYPNVTALRIKDALNRVNELTASIGAAVRVIAAITLIAGVLVLAGAIAAGHRRRVYDSVILKVLGATRRDVLRAFLLEYGLLGLVTALIAAAIGTVTAWAVLIWVMRSDWTFLPEAVALTVLLCTAITLLAGFAGTWRALGQKAAPLLRNE